MKGEIIDKYQIIDKIGEGGMAAVYHARHLGLQRDVAIKIIHPMLAENEKNRQRFEREARAIERLDQENIVKILDYSGNANQYCYIVTELVEGLNLRQLMLEQREIPSEVIAMIGIEVCKALSYAHTQGFIHRDIKPENIMIRTDGVIKLLDFGVARFVDEESLTMTKSLVGSPAYMSPEQAKDEEDGELDLRSDLFSLGIVLFQMSTRELPFHGSNFSVILKNIIDNKRNQAHCIEPQISLALNDCIENLLQNNREMRPKSADVVGRELEKVLIEAQLDRSDVQWSLKYWLADPASFQHRLHQHLQNVLLEEGKRLLSVGQQLEAQRYFNRLLCIEPNNDQVFELLQTIHSVVDVPRKTEAKIHIAWYIVPTLLAIAVFSIISYTKKSPESAVLVSDPVTRNVPEQTKILDKMVEVVPNDTMFSDMVDELPMNVTVTEPAVSTVTNEVNGTLSETVSPPNSNDKILAIKNRTVISESVGQKIPKVLPKISNPVVKQPTENIEISKENLDKEPTLMGSVTISIPSSWADIWLDGVLIGRTGQVAAINLTVGVHELRLENPYSLPYTEQIEISAGQHKKMEITALQRKPAYLVFSAQLSPECGVLLDGKDVGELGVINYKLTITEPNLPHEVGLDCPDQQLSQEIAQLAPGSTNPIRFN